MTEVAFHFNAPDKLGYACRLLRKAYLRGARVVVLVDEFDTLRLDALLWTMTPGAFIPHSIPSDSGSVASHSPIHLASSLPAQTQATVLVNLRSEVPDGFDAYGRVIEVVTGEEADRQRARERWKIYKANGLEPERHDLRASPTELQSSD
jgi:DNA polymerase-3 subunit chi